MYSSMFNMPAMSLALKSLSIKYCNCRRHMPTVGVSKEGEEILEL